MNAETEPAAPRRARLVVAYDGTGFHGFAESAATPTVMGVLREAIERVIRRPVELVGAGRTDAGVHAWGQVVSGDLPGDVDLGDLARRVTRMCGPSVVIRSAAWADDPAFSARFSARFRHYRYDVVNQPVPVPALAGRAWHVAAPLNVHAMRLACDPFIGEHDFSSFCRAPRQQQPQARAGELELGRPAPSLRRRVMLAQWTEVDDDHGPVLRFEIRANAFCHQMVRSIVGTMIDVGHGKLHAGDVRSIMLAHDRSRAGQVAPPHGLTLWDVGY